MTRTVPAVSFLAAGLLMIVSVGLIVLDRFGVEKVPEAWIAVPAIAAQAACIAGLMSLRPLLGRAVMLSRLGLAIVLMAAVIIAAGGVWIAMAGGDAARLGMGIYVLAFAYILAMCLAFALFSAAAFRVHGARSVLPYLLLAPAGLWMMLVIAAGMAGPQVALSLDWITNGVIAMVLLATAVVVRRS